MDGTYTWTMREVEGRLSGPLDERLTLPRSYLAGDSGDWAWNFGQWPRYFDVLDFYPAPGLSGNFYDDCAGYELFHPQHVVRLPNKNGRAYFMVAQSRAHNGYISVLQTGPGTVDTNDIVRQQPGQPAGYYIWQDFYSGLFNGNINPIGNWNHPCKMEVIGGLLVVTAQNWSENRPCFFGRGDSEDALLFYDVRDPEFPRYWGKINASSLFMAALEGVTIVRRPSDGMYILTVEGNSCSGRYLSFRSPLISLNVNHPNSANPNPNDWTFNGGGDLSCQGVTYPLPPGIGEGSIGPIAQHGMAFNSLQLKSPSTSGLPRGAERIMWYDAVDSGKILQFSELVPGGNVFSWPSYQPFANRHWDADSIYVTPAGMPIIYTMESAPGENGRLFQTYDDRNNPASNPWLVVPHPDQVVTNLADSGPGSLRRAIAYGGRITFDPALNGRAINLTGGPLVVYLYDVNIDASALPNGIAIYANGDAPTFQVLPGKTLTMNGLGGLTTVIREQPGSWFRQTAIRHDGGSALQSGDIADSQATSLEGSVTGPGTLTFWWKVSSEFGWDYLRFYLDGVEQPAAPGISGAVDWQQKSITIPAGSHALRWSYSKDGSVSTGSDAGWLDQVEFSPPLVTLLAEGGPWKYLADGSDPGTAWRAPGFNDSTWSNGVARLGFGGDGEATTIASAASNFVTFYFRQSFTVANAADVSSLFGQIQADDGVILYLNGTEIYRRNMTNDAATLNFRSLASFTVSAAEETTFWTFLINGGALVNGVNVLAAEVHQAATNSSDLGFNLDLVGNYLGTLPPVITVTSPTDTAPYNAAGVPLRVSARDPEGAVTNVDFYVDGQFVSRATNAPFTGLWATPALGTHTVRAVATDDTGLSTSSPTTSFLVVPPAVVTTLVNSNATWRYLDDGSNQGLLWRTNDYNDSGWSNGVAELGYGDGPALPEATVIRSTGTNGARIITTYFRKTFPVDNPALYSNLVVRLRRDDGGVVYLNGVEIFRSNMTNAPGVPVLFGDLAANAADEVSFFSTSAPASLLRAGDNLVAVEIHQATVASSDVSFDLQLQGEGGPLLFINRSAGLVTLNWLPAVFGLQLQYAATPGGPWTAAPNQANPQSFTVSPLDLPVFWRLLAP